MRKIGIRRILCSVLILMQILPAFLCFSAFAVPSVIAFNVIAGPDARTVYAEGDCFAPYGFEGILTYSDKTTETLSSAVMTYSVDNPLKTSTTKVTFYSGKTTKYAEAEIHVLGLTSLVPSGAYKTDYYAGEEIFDPNGLTYTIVYSENIEGQEPLVIEREISSTAVTYSVTEDEYLSSDIKSVTAFYSNGTTTVSCAIPVNVKSISTLTITNAPQGPFYEGSLLTYSEEELKVEAIYEGETEARPVTNFTIENLDSPMFGEFSEIENNYVCTFNVKYDNKTAAFSVRLYELNFDSIVATSSTGIQYIYPNEKTNFDPTRVNVTAVYLINNEEVIVDVSDYTEFTYPEIIRFGDTVTATFAGRQIDLSEVLKIHTATFVVSNHATKTTYVEGETFNPSGFLGLITFDDVNQTMIPVNHNSLELDAPEILSITDSYVTFSWYGLTYKEAIMVMPAKEMAISISTPPEKVNYVTYESVSLEGLVLTLVVEGEEPRTLVASDIYSDIPSGGCITTIPAVGSPIGSSADYIIIRYHTSETVYYETTQPISVIEKTASSLSYTTKPNIVFEEGAPINTDKLSLKLQLNYNDGSHIIITSGYTIDTEYLILKEDSEADYVEVPVTIYYGDLYCTLKVKVRPAKVEQIIISEYPLQSYNIGEFFNPEGMKIYASFENSAQYAVPVPDDYYTYSPARLTKAGQQKITITFRGVTTELNVYVTDDTVVTTDPGITDTTAAPVTTGTPVTTQKPAVTTSPEETTGTTSKPGKTGSSNNFLVLWIIIIVIIVAGIVVLIIYYKRNFT